MNVTKCDGICDCPTPDDGKTCPDEDEKNCPKPCQENAVPVDCTVNNNGHQRKCHNFASEVLPFDDPCCECTHGTAFNGTACIDESRCPCQENGIVRLPGEKWADDDDQCKIKSCLNNEIIILQNRREECKPSDCNDCCNDGCYSSAATNLPTSPSYSSERTRFTSTGMPKTTEHHVTMTPTSLTEETTAPYSPKTRSTTETGLHSTAKTSILTSPETTKQPGSSTVVTLPSSLETQWMNLQTMQKQKKC
jgi:hypothetical protein